MAEKPKLLYITRKEHFNAAHKLYNPNWTEEENDAVFGRCANKNWHGHNFELYVTVKGYPNPDTGFIMDLKKLKVIINEKVIDKLDHRNINEDVDFMKGKMASIENLVTAIWEQLEAPINAHGCRLHYLKLVETERNFVEYYGEE
ncbi:MAG TPA: 6-carboxytetrahydropterin synthase [Bacteroidia bacterium]|nr:6-carboxytetrahydropterin synthase [Bacteroidia bacterium]